MVRTVGWIVALQDEPEMGWRERGSWREKSGEREQQGERSTSFEALELTLDLSCIP